MKRLREWLASNVIFVRHEGRTALGASYVARSAEQDGPYVYIHDAEIQIDLILWTLAIRIA